MVVPARARGRTPSGISGSSGATTGRRPCAPSSRCAHRRSGCGPPRGCRRRACPCVPRCARRGRPPCAPPRRLPRPPPAGGAGLLLGHTALAATRRASRRLPRAARRGTGAARRTGLPAGAGRAGGPRRPLAFRARRGRLAGDELVEVAPLTAGGRVLVDEREPALVELLEPLLPVDPVQRALAGVPGEIDADDPGVVGAARCRRHLRRPAAALLDPAPDRLRDRSSSATSLEPCVTSLNAYRVCTASSRRQAAQPSSRAADARRAAAARVARLNDARGVPRRVEGPRPPDAARLLAVSGSGADVGATPVPRAVTACGRAAPGPISAPTRRSSTCALT